MGVDLQLDLRPDELREAISDAHGLIVRSATTVDAEVIAAARELVVIGRAGIGLDNVDVDAATGRGVLVVNAPQANVLSAAEHTMALLLAQARNVPQAHGALVAGRWERARWEGVELHGKTLGIIGFGRIGRLVAQRASAFGMRLVAHDPFVASERARQLNVEMMELDDLLAVADFLTVHVAKTPETIGLIGKELLARAKPNLRIVNVARGGIIDEQALAEALREGVVAGAAIDVFETEPTTESPLFELDSVVVTPHLGASTREAQDKAGATIAEQVELALAGEFVPLAVNVSAGEVSETVRPYLPLAERLGDLFSSLCGGVIPVLEVTYEGQLAEYDTEILTLAVLKGFFSQSTEDPVSFVNAPRLAEHRGVEVRATSTTTAKDYLNRIILRGGENSLAGTLVGATAKPRIVMLDDHVVDVPPAQQMLVVRNADTPGMIGVVGTLLGDAGINIDDLHLGKDPAGNAAMMVLATDVPVPDEVQATLLATTGIVSVVALS